MPETGIPEAGIEETGGIPETGMPETGMPPAGPNGSETAGGGGDAWNGCCDCWCGDM
jgi:hypothetical protein